MARRELCPVSSTNQIVEIELFCFSGESSLQFPARALRVVMDRVTNGFGSNWVVFRAARQVVWRCVGTKVQMSWTCGLPSRARGADAGPTDQLTVAALRSGWCHTTALGLCPTGPCPARLACHTICSGSKVSGYSFSAACTSFLQVAFEMAKIFGQWFLFNFYVAKIHEDSSLPLRKV